jgi:glyoxylase-like metal-dependent hydrolase (beta-lactamase superfamily II)
VPLKGIEAFLMGDDSTFNKWESLFLHQILASMKTVVEKMTFNPFQENTYVVHDGTSCVIIDPGCFKSSEEEYLVNFIESNKLTLVAVLLTHGHLDHIAGLDFINRKYGVDVYLNETDLPTFNASHLAANLYGLRGFVQPEVPNKLLKGNEELVFGDMKFNVINAPGHCIGHVVFHNEEDGYVLNGDVIMKGSHGRTDLPGGDSATLKRTILETMFNLPNETIIYSGHGPETNVEIEKQTNVVLMGSLG